MRNGSREAFGLRPSSAALFFEPHNLMREENLLLEGRHFSYHSAMKTILEEKEQFVVDASGQRVGVLLDLPTYDRLREAAEDNADIRSYRAAKSRVAGEIARGDYATLADYRSKRSRKQK